MKKNQNSLFRRSLALALALVMCLGMFQVAAVAEGSWPCGQVDSDGNHKVNWQTKIHPNCGTPGLKFAICDGSSIAKCDFYKEEIIPATGDHVWSTVYSIVDGGHARQCTVCGQFETTQPHEEVDSGEYATCTDKGNRVTTCKVCHAVLGHPDHDWQMGHKFGPWYPVMETDDTSTEHVRECTNVNRNTNSVCGEKETAPHNFSDWRMVKEPTLTAEGLAVRECSDCQYKEEDVLAKLIEPDDEATLTIEYDFVDGPKANDDYTVTKTYKTGSHESYNTPDVEGYTAEFLKVDADDHPSGGTVTVKYFANEYKLTIKCVDPAGKELGTKVVVVKYGTNYGEDVPKITGYDHAEKVDGIMPAGEKTETVVCTPKAYELTINYVDDYNRSVNVADSKTTTVHYGDKVTIKSEDCPEVEGYILAAGEGNDSFVQNEFVVDGDIINGTKVIVDIFYKIKTFTRTITYSYADGQEGDAEDLPPTVHQTAEYGKSFAAVSSAPIDGYTAYPAVVEGIAEVKDNAVDVNVIYSRTPIPTHTLTINYEYEDGRTAAGSYSNANMIAGASYSVVSPTITNYSASVETVSGVMPDGDVTVTVTYTYVPPYIPPATPDEPDEPVIDVPDPEVPMGTPDVDPTEEPTQEPTEEPTSEPTEEPDVDIDEPDVPLGPGPDVTDEPTQTPAPTQAPAPAEDNKPEPPTNDGDTEIEDEVTPLAAAPKTGDDFSMVLMLMLASGCGLVLMGMKSCKKREEK